MSHDRRTPGDPLLDAPHEELEFSEEELAEAQTLAAALEGKTFDSARRSAAPAPEVSSAVESAALLRVSRALELPAARQADILEKLLQETARIAAPRRAPLRRMWWWLLPLPAAAFAAVLMSKDQLGTTDASRTAAVAVESSASVQAPLPEPSAEVIAAQAKAIAALMSEKGVGSTTESPQQYEVAFASYRAEYLAALEDTYR